MTQYGAGGSGGTINANANPSIANPITFIFLNGNSGVTGTASGANGAVSYGNANVGYGGHDGVLSVNNGQYIGAGGSGGAGAYVQIIYNGGQVPYNSTLNYILGNAGIGGAANGETGGIRITWS